MSYSFDILDCVNVLNVNAGKFYSEETRGRSRRVWTWSAIRVPRTMIRLDSFHPTLHSFPVKQLISNIVIQEDYINRGIQKNWIVVFLHTKLFHKFCSKKGTTAFEKNELQGCIKMPSCKFSCHHEVFWWPSPDVLMVNRSQFPKLVSILIYW